MKRTEPLVRPATDGFSIWSLAAVGSAATLVVRELATRRVGSDVPALSIAFVTAVGLSALTGFMSIFSSWSAVTPKAALMIGLACCSLFVGYLCAIQTVRVGDLSVSAPFRYTTLVGAVVIGYLFFAEIPDELTIIGSMLVVLTGLYSVYLERREAVTRV